MTLTASFATSFVFLVLLIAFVRNRWLIAAISLCFAMMMFFVASMPAARQGLFTLPLLLLAFVPERIEVADRNRVRRWGNLAFTIAAILAVLPAYWYPIKWSNEWLARVAAEQTLVPLLSLEERLPSPPRTHTGQAIDQQALTKLNSQVERDDWRTKLATNLKLLHEVRVDRFVNSPGLGRLRMGPLNTRSYDEDEPLPIPQPRRVVRSEGEIGELFNPPKSEVKLFGLHLDGVVDFVNPQGLGYFRSRREVAGFRSHRFSKVPKADVGWDVDSLELVGVLVHETPQVYVSDHLPRMD